nr:putative reverse transcriptase domain-containing protein [Tanacetum cinerariifolium]
MASRPLSFHILYQSVYPSFHLEVQQFVDLLLTDEAIRNGSLKKKTKKRENGGELSRNENVRDHNKRSRTIRVFSIITNPVRKEYTGTTPKCTNCSFYHNHEMPCCKCTDCNHLRNFASDCRVGPRMVTLVNAKNLKTTRGACFMYGGTDHYKAAFPRLNRAPRPGGNCQNQPMAIEGGQGSRNNGNQACGGVFIIGAEEARQDPNIVMEDLSSRLNPYGHFKFTAMPFGLRNAPMANEEHEMHLGLILELLKREKLYTKFSKCEFWLQEVQFLRYVINDDGMHVDPSKIEDAKNWEALRRPSEILKDKLCNTPVLALPDGPEDFVVYCNASGLGIDPNKIEYVKNWEALRRPSEVSSFLRLAGYYRRFIENLSKITKPLTILTQKNKTYVSGKVNVVANALSRKERIKPTKVQVINMTIHSSIKDRILATQKEVYEVVNTPAEMLRGLDKQMERSSDGAWTSSGHDEIWVIVDRLTKLAHFLPIREDYKVDMLARLYLSDIIARHGMPISIISDRDSRLHQGFDSQCKRHYKLECVMDFGGSLDVYHLLVEFSYTNSYHSSVRCASFEALYRRKCRSPILSAEVRKGQLIGPEIVQETTEKIS